MRFALKKLLPRPSAYAIARAFMLFIFLQAVIPLAVRSAAASPPDIAGRPSLAGFWVTQDGNWVVQISPCDGAFCGRLVVLSKSHRPDALRLDARNPDPASRRHPLCGLRLLGGFTPSDNQPGTWQGGWVYDPQNGKTYASHMWLDGPDTLKIRGYVLVSLLGRNETLARATTPIKPCSTAPAG
jgi:uncharacterized protein (DUF2147 family)